MNIKVKPDITKYDLYYYGFEKKRDSRGHFVYTKPAYFYRKYPVIFLEINIFLDNNKKQHEIIINCKNADDSLYRPYYAQKTYAENVVLEEVMHQYERIIKDLVKQGILRVDFKKSNQGPHKRKNHNHTPDHKKQKTIKRSGNHANNKKKAV